MVKINSRGREGEVAGLAQDSETQTISVLDHETGNASPWAKDRCPSKPERYSVTPDL